MDVNVGAERRATRFPLAEVLASVLGLAGAMLAAITLSIDYFGGRPDFGLRQWAALGVGAAMVLAATAIRYRAPDLRREGLRFTTLLLQASLLYLVVRAYELESAAFHDFLFGIIVTGFVMQHFVAARNRMALFVALSIAAMLCILGPANGLIALGIGLVLIGICHLPISLLWRAGLLVSAGAGLAGVRAGWIPNDRVEAVLPIVGSIFMFRLIIYLYDMQNGKVPKAWAERLSYFFMLPNFAFPFFPVVDLSAWNRSHQAAASMETYQKGMIWILIGISHLLLYRFVNYNVAFEPSDVAGFWMFLYYCIANFGLYLKISGLFHLILGCLFLYGFALPETHSRYYLSFSFIEFWRRINIYWKDFMQKMVFNPVFTWAKRRSLAHLHAIVVAIIAVFFATWVLHAYQWFWLRGTLLLTVPDVLFWAVLCAFLVIQTVKESRPAPKTGRALIGPVALQAIRTVATMLTIVILWSMWSSETMGAWFALLGRSGLTLLDASAGGTLADYLRSAAFVAFLVACVALALGFTFGLAPAGKPAQTRTLAARRGAYSFSGNALLASAVSAALVAAQVPAVYGILPRSVQLFAVDMATARLSSRDQVKLERGYYENLTDVRIINSELWTMQSGVRDDRDTIDQTSATSHVDDYRDYVLNPDVVMEFKGSLFSTNSLGLRDREYAVETPPGVHRIALIGDSRAMGTGVRDEQTFENLLEDSLNERFGGKVEILNFGVAGYDAFQKTIALDRATSQFKPVTVLYLAHNTELELRRYFGNAVASGISPGAYAQPILDAAGVRPGMSPDVVLELVHRHTPELVRAAYVEFAGKVRAAGALPVWIFLPSTRPYADPLPEGKMLRQFAEEAGFVTIDLFDIYNQAEGDGSGLWISAVDDHPNAFANQIIAKRLEAELLSRPEILPCCTN